MRFGSRLSAIGVAALLTSAAGITNSVGTYARTAHQWGIEEITLHSAKSYSNSFADVELKAQFVCGAQTVQTSGFFDGQNTWKVRFMPELRGPCSFVTTSNDPELDHFSGRFTVDSPEPGNHGPVHEAKTFHFSYADGTPYFVLGTTLYNWINRDEALQQHTIESLRHSPFTKIRFGLFPKWYAFNRIDPELYPYQQRGPNQFDLDRFNPAFFQHVERRIRDLQALGIQADIILFHPYDHWGFATMDAAHDDAYIRYVTARLSAFHNVWWTMANEYDLFVPSANNPLQHVKDWDRMFQVLEQSDPYNHPRGIHNLATWYDHSKPWISHVIIQDGTSTPARRVPGARSRFGKPVVVDEFGYEGDNGMNWGNLSGAEEVSRAWDITMAGAYLSHGETYVHPGGVLWWAAGGRLVGESVSRLAFLKTVMTAAPFQDLLPSPELGLGGAVLAKKGDYYLFRIKTVTRGVPDEIQLDGDGPYRVDMIDPWTMQVYPLGYVQAGLQAFVPVMAPCLFRFIKVRHSDGDNPSGSLEQLLAKFIADPTLKEPQKTPLPADVTEYYSQHYTIGELLDDPRTIVIVEKYLSADQRRLRFLALDQLEQFSGADFSPENYSALLHELRKIPVQPQ